MKQDNQGRWNLSMLPKQACIEDTHEIQQDTVGKQWCIYLVINSLSW